MKQGWYSTAQNRETVAYFDGVSWGPPTPASELSTENREGITALPDTPPPPPVPEAREMAAGPTPVHNMRPGTAWYCGILSGLILIVVGFVYGFSPAGNTCGAPFKESNVAAYADAYGLDNGYGYGGFEAQCEANIADATVTTWVLIGFGVLIALVSALIMATIRSGHSRRTASAPQGLVSRIEDLARLRDKGLITTAEYEKKRLELIDA